MEVYSRNEEISDNKIFKNKLLKDINKDDNQKLPKNDKNELKSTPKKKKPDNILQQNYEETKIVKETDPNNKETFMSIKSKVVYGENSKENKQKNPDSKEKKTDTPIKKALFATQEIKKPSDEELIDAELKKLSENKNKNEKNDNKLTNNSKEKIKKSEQKNEIATEISRNSNELPKKENIDTDFLNKKKNIEKHTNNKHVENEQKPYEKPEIASKTTKKVNLQEPLKVFFDLFH